MRVGQRDKGGSFFYKQRSSGKEGAKVFVAMNRNKEKLIKRVDETFLGVFGGMWIESPIT